MTRNPPSAEALAMAFGLLTIASLVVSAGLARATGCAAIQPSRWDVAPGEAGPSPGDWTVLGDGRIQVEDVVVLLRMAVGLAHPAWAPVGPLTGDLAPGRVEERVAVPAWVPLGDGAVAVGDVVIALRLAVGVYRPTPDEGATASLPTFRGEVAIADWLKERASHEARDATRWSWPSRFEEEGWGSVWDDPLEESPGALGGPVTVPETWPRNPALRRLAHDGSWVVALTGSQVLVFARESGRPELRWTQPLEGSPLGLRLRGNRLLVAERLATAPESRSGQHVPLRWQRGLDKLTLFELDPQRGPTARRETYVEGHVDRFSLTGESVATTMHHDLLGPPRPSACPDKATFIAAAEEALQDWRSSDWLPREADFTWEAGRWNRDVRPIVSPDQVYLPTGAEGVEFRSLVAWSASADGRSAVAIMGQGDCLHWDDRSAWLVVDERGAAGAAWLQPASLSLAGQWTLPPGWRVRSPSSLRSLPIAPGSPGARLFVTQEASTSGLRWPSASVSIDEASCLALPSLPPNPTFVLHGREHSWLHAPTAPEWRRIDWPAGTVESAVARPGPSWVSIALTDAGDLIGCEQVADPDGGQVLRAEYLRPDRLVGTELQLSGPYVAVGSASAEWNEELGRLLLPVLEYRRGDPSWVVSRVGLHLLSWDESAGWGAPRWLDCAALFSTAEFEGVHLLGTKSVVELLELQELVAVLTEEGIGFMDPAADWSWRLVVVADGDG